MGVMKFVLHFQGCQEVQMTVSLIKVESQCLIQAVSPEPESSASFDEGIDIIFSTNAVGDSRVTGESSPSQKRVLFSETRFCLRNHGNLSPGLRIESVHP